MKNPTEHHVQRSTGLTRVVCRGVSEVLFRTPVDLSTIAHEVYHATICWVSDEEKVACAVGELTERVTYITQKAGQLHEPQKKSRGK